MILFKKNKISVLLCTSALFTSALFAAPNTQSNVLYTQKIQKKYGLTEYIVKNNINEVRTLLTQGVNPNQCAAGQIKPLFKAIEKNHIKIAELLLQHKAEVNVPDQDENTALMQAVQTNNPKMLTLLLEYGAQIDAQRQNGDTALIQAVMQENLEAADCLIKQGADINIDKDRPYTLLMRALFENKLKAVQFLLQHNVDINAQDNLGRTALIRAIMGERLDIVEFLLKHGANINIQDKYKKTALIWSAYNKTSVATEYLVKQGADINIQDNAGHTALIKAIKNNRLNTAKYLIQRGADLNIQDTEGYTALMHAVGHGGHIEIIRALLDKNVNTERQDTYNKTALFYAYQSVINNSHNPLHYLHNLQFLLAYGVATTLPNTTVSQINVKAEYVEAALKTLLISERPLLEHLNNPEFRQRFSHLDKEQITQLIRKATRIDTQKIHALIQNNEYINEKFASKITPTHQALALMSAADFFKEFTCRFFPERQVAVKAITGLKSSQLKKDFCNIKPNWKRTLCSESEASNPLATTPCLEALIEHMPSKDAFVYLREQFYQIVMTYIEQQNKQTLEENLRNIHSQLQTWVDNSVLSKRQAKLGEDMFSAENIQGFLKQ